MTADYHYFLSILRSSYFAGNVEFSDSLLWYDLDVCTIWSNRTVKEKYPHPNPPPPKKTPQKTNIDLFKLSVDFEKACAHLEGEGVSKIYKVKFPKICFKAPPPRANSNILQTPTPPHPRFFFYPRMKRAILL